MADFQEKIAFIRDERLDLLERLQEQKMEVLQVLGNIPIANAANTDVTVQAWQCVELYLSLKEDILSMVA